MSPGNYCLMCAVVFFAVSSGRTRMSPKPGCSVSHVSLSDKFAISLSFKDGHRKIAEFWVLDTVGYHQLQSHRSPAPLFLACSGLSLTSALPLLFILCT